MPAVFEAQTATTTAVLPPAYLTTKAQAGVVSTRRRRLLVRFCEIFPAAFAFAVITALLAGPFWFAGELLVGVLLFETYWLWKSWTIGYHALKGAGLMRAAIRTDWRAAYGSAPGDGGEALPWDAVRHVVIIPNYGESSEKLRVTLSTLAASPGAAAAIIPVLAMEAAEEGSRQKGEALAVEFADRFYDLLVTVHPADIPGELRGKSSNEAWAARCAVEELVDRGGLKLDHLTVTSCDADTQFAPMYFEALTCHFATDPARYARFWQAPIFFYNNIWQVPGPLRIPNALSGLIHLGKLSRKRRVLFPQSTYSLSLRLAHDVGYWDVDVIPEDWHMFLKCYYHTGGEVDIEPIMIPLGNDGALSATTWKTMLNQYLQVRRWGWGASDIPYAVTQALDHSEMSLRRRFQRCWYLIDNHISWSTQWFAVTLGSLLTVVDWMFSWQLIKPEWFYVGSLLGLSLPGWLTLSTLIMTPCLLPYLILIVLDMRLRPPAPPGVTRRGRFAAFGWWLASSPITLVWSALPALDAQIRLLLGKRMEYRVTEKV